MISNLLALTFLFHKVGAAKQHIFLGNEQRTVTSQLRQFASFCSMKHVSFYDVLCRLRVTISSYEFINLSSLCDEKSKFYLNTSAAQLKFYFKWIIMGNS